MEILTNPAILFFVFGLVAGALRSDLEIPGAIAKFLSLYLLMALGLKGGFALEHSGLNFGVTVTLLAAMLLDEQVRLPGERRRQIVKASQTGGIAVPEAMLRDLHRLAGDAD
jgi:hypothetical protein